MLLVSAINNIPFWWDNEGTNSRETTIIKWPLINKISMEISELFYSSLNSQKEFEIDSIYSVQNTYLWKSYQYQRSLHEEAIGMLFHNISYDRIYNSL